jgi:hypothetical protein
MLPASHPAPKAGLFASFARRFEEPLPALVILGHRLRVSSLRDHRVHCARILAPNRPRHHSGSLHRWDPAGQAQWHPAWNKTIIAPLPEVAGFGIVIVSCLSLQPLLQGMSGS